MPVTRALELLRFLRRPLENYFPLALWAGPNGIRTRV